jgi:hypothetical protein
VTISFFEMFAECFGCFPGKSQEFVDGFRHVATGFSESKSLSQFAWVAASEEAPPLSPSTKDRRKQPRALFFMGT